MQLDEKIKLRKDNGFDYMEWDRKGWEELKRIMKAKSIEKINEHYDYLGVSHYLNHDWPSPESINSK